MNFIGKPSIHPLVFYSGKIAGYIIWAYLFIEIFRDNFSQVFADWKGVVTWTLTVAGLIISSIGIFNLGKSIRAGLPFEDTVLKTGGIYNYSRNPIYLGFNLLSLAAMLLIPSALVISLGIFNLVTHHLIILAEEDFLTDRFGKEYQVYRNQVRRYF